MKNMKAKLVLGVAVLSLMGSLAGCGIHESVDVSAEYLSEYPIYESIEQEYRDMGNELVTKYIKEGKTEEEACKQAITEVLDKKFNDDCDFIVKYTMDMDDNGISDAVERGEITQEEIDDHFKDWVSVGSENDTEL